MFSNSHSYTHLILALGIVREPTIWVFITSKYPGIHDTGLATSVCSEVRTHIFRLNICFSCTSINMLGAVAEVLQQFCSLSEEDGR